MATASSTTASDVRPEPFVVPVRARAELPWALASLRDRSGPGPVAGRPVLVSIGGAAGMARADLEVIVDLLRREVVPRVERHRAVVVDGGTDAGVMQLLGQARHASGAAFPLVGVAARGTVRPIGGPGTARVEPHHTHLVLVPGNDWGDESGWLAAVATELAGPARSVSLLVNGGEIAYRDVGHSLAEGRPVIVVAGTGRTADDIAAARAGRPASRRATRIAGSGLVQVVALDDAGALGVALDRALDPREVSSRTGAAARTA